MDELVKKYPEAKVYDFEVWSNNKNRKHLIEVGKILGKDVSGVPFTVIGNEAFVDFSPSLTSTIIEDKVRYCIEKNCPDSVAKIVGLLPQNDSSSLPPTTKPYKIIPEKINLPLFGEIQTKDLSLPALKILLGTLDGFNPCAMWTLIF